MHNRTVARGIVIQKEVGSRDHDTLQGRREIPIIISRDRASKILQLLHRLIHALKILKARRFSVRIPVESN